MWRQSKESVAFTALNTVTVIEKNVDILAVASLLGTSQAGIYGFISRVFKISNIAQAAINVVYAPNAARLYAKRKLVELDSSSKKVTILGFMNAFLFLVFVIVFGKDLSSWVSDELLIGYPALVILLVAGVLRSIAGPVSVTATMTGQQKSALKITVLTLSVGVIFLIVLTQLFGIVGAAVATGMMVVSRAWLLRNMLWNDRKRLK